MTTPKERKSYKDDFVTRVLKEAKKGVAINLLEHKYKVTYSTIVKWCEQALVVPVKSGRHHDWEAIKRALA